MIALDGSLGEGGGQVLRSALSLSLLTGQELCLTNIRARRKNPGLQAQHLQAVQAAAAISNAEVEGAQLRSQALVFKPGMLKAGKYRFEIGTAGAATLVLQTIVLPLTRAAAPSTVEIGGGTHVPWSPCFHYLDLNWLPMLWQMGCDARLSLLRAGFYPRGGGEIRAAITPAQSLAPLQLEQRGKLLQVRGLAAVANLPRQVSSRMRRQIVGRLGSRYPLNDLRLVELSAPSPGAFLLLFAEYEHSHCCYFALGEKGKPAERVADEAAQGFEGFDASGAAIDEYLADQLLLPLALAGGASSFTTARITSHLLTNAAVIRAFLPVEIAIEGQPGQPGRVRVIP